VVTRIVIIGGGPAGYEAALVAAGRGPGVAQITVIDSDGLGGACVLWDCVPSKTFIASTGVRTELRRADGLGFDIAIEDAKISLAQIHSRVKTLARSQSADIGSQCRPMPNTRISTMAEMNSGTTPRVWPTTTMVLSIQRSCLSAANTPAATPSGTVIRKASAASFREFAAACATNGPTGARKTKEVPISPAAKWLIQCQYCTRRGRSAPIS